ncbi:MAG: hypothetical protein LQ343_000140 [Gyalolechia ehrenbergii]|nr:MAG: hypothetical protein LQ343_000140 [Gyalolechia ehrenbergii]
MATQYDNIGTLFDQMRKTPQAKLVDYNVQRAVTPYIKGAKVLDLACGTGHFSTKALEWGAAPVFGVDISSAMIEAAETANATIHPAGSLQFETADCSIPKIFGTGSYDLILGVWFLNYCSTKAQMTGMYRTISLNLKPGGIFVGVNPYPTEDPRSLHEKEIQIRPIGLDIVAPIVKNDIDDGVALHIITTVESGRLEFDNFHLRKSIYEAAAREGGLMGKLVWKDVEIPQGIVDGEVRERDREIWRSLAEYGGFRVLMVWKE